MPSTSIDPTDGASIEWANPEPTPTGNPGPPNRSKAPREPSAAVEELLARSDTFTIGHEDDTGATRRWWLPAAAAVTIAALLGMTALATLDSGGNNTTGVQAAAPALDAAPTTSAAPTVVSTATPAPTVPPAPTAPPVPTATAAPAEALVAELTVQPSVVAEPGTYEFDVTGTGWEELPIFVLACDVEIHPDQPIHQSSCDLSALTPVLSTDPDGTWTATVSFAVPAEGLAIAAGDPIVGGVSATALVTIK